MKSITSKTIIIATCIAFCQFAQAQDPTPSPTPKDKPAASPTPKDKAGKPCPKGCEKGERGKHHPRERMERLSEKLGLSDQQKTQLQEIFKAHRAQMDAIRDDQTLTPDAKREKMKGVMADIKSQAKSILTPEQMQKWDAMKEERKEHHHGPKGAQPTP
jgi:Spy/CpxP family protein refolding chaperone